jgi:hypothetical protein
MTTAPAVDPGPARAREQHHGPGMRWDRVVLGLLIAGGGVASLLSGTGTDVPWNLLPAAALVLVGVVLLLSLAGGTGRGGVAFIGIVLLAVAVAVGVGAERYAGPVGDRTVVPGPADWAGGTTRISAGTVIVDLTRAAPPETGLLRVEVGAGRVVLRLPDGGTAGDGGVAVTARVVAGTVAVDGSTVQQGVDLRWAEPAGRSPAPVVELDIGTGDLEVRHVAS